MNATAGQGQRPRQFRSATLETVKAEWDDLADSVDAMPFLRPGWVGAWWRAFGAGELVVFTLRRSGRLVAVLPLGSSRGVRRSPTNWHTPEFGVLCEDGESIALMEELLAKVRTFRRVSISFIDSERQPLQSWRASAEGSRWLVETRDIARLAAVDLRPFADPASFDASLSRSLRYDLLRSARRLETLGPVSFSVSRGSQGSLGLLLDKGFAAEGSGWKAEHGTAIVSRPETERFYREIAAWAASRGMLRLAFLHVGDRVAAFQIALTGQGTWYALKSGFNPEFRAGSPGKLLMHETLRHAISAEIASYRMGAVEGYKLRWANTFTSLSQIQAFPPSVLGRVDWAAFRYGRPMAESLRRLRGTSRRPGGDATAETPG